MLFLLSADDRYSGLARTNIRYSKNGGGEGKSLNGGRKKLSAHSAIDVYNI